MTEQIIQKFEQLFQERPVVVRSPGRVNLIGEHTDYNDGFVLPAAINKEIIFAIAPSDSSSTRIYSLDMDEEISLDLRNLQKSSTSWHNYLIGVIAQFQKVWYPIKNFNLVFGGNVPIGSGMSSSAAVECGLAYALNYIYEFNLNKMKLARMAQKAEHEYAGVMCGIMDQFANLFGKQDQVIRLDCRSLDYEYYPFNFKDYAIVLCDTQVKHSLASSEYNNRRKECQQGVAIIQQVYPQIRSLRDVKLSMLEALKERFDPVIYKRCRYVVEENLRVEKACQELQAGDLDAFGQFMNQGHAGLRDDYQVSCPELDFLAEQAWNRPEVKGARMMGGGFGGCSINIVKDDAIEAFRAEMNQKYLEKYQRELPVYVCKIVNGTSLLG